MKVTDRRAMIEDCAKRGRPLLERMRLENGSAAHIVWMFAALTPAQRAEMMKHYKKDGTVR